MTEEFRELFYHAKEVNKEPTRWRVGEDVERALKSQLGYVWSHGEISTLLGVPVERDQELPYGRVILECGEWTAGAFTMDIWGEGIDPEAEKNT